MNLGMTIQQAAITWSCFITAAAAITAWVITEIKMRRRRSFNRHTHDALNITKADRRAELKALQTSWNMPAKDRADS